MSGHLRLALLAALAGPTLAAPQRPASKLTPMSDEACSCGCPDPDDIGIPECPRDYANSTVFALASRKAVAAAQANQSKTRADSIAACARMSHGQILDTGSWCLEGEEVVPQSRGRPLSPDSAYTEYVLPQYHVRPAQALLDVAEVVLTANGTASKIASLNDLGAGVGQLGNALKAVHPDLEYRAYDGAGNTEEFTHGLVAFADLTLPADIPPASWALSSEVGEHIPHVDEAQFVANLHRANCRGLILTWGAVGQGGHGHVNLHSTEYLLALFEELGYRLHAPYTSLLRAKATDARETSYLAVDSMVLERIRPEC